MIQKLQQNNITIAKKIRAVFQASYKVEAEILGAKDFPPLKRPLEAYIDCPNLFYGCIKDGELAGVTEIIHNTEFTHFRSLVVDPRFFRQGIASALIRHIFNTFDANLFIVETGVDNEPAIALYKQFGFHEVSQWDTAHNIRKVKFERRLKA